MTTRSAILLLAFALVLPACLYQVLADDGSTRALAQEKVLEDFEGGGEGWSGGSVVPARDGKAGQVTVDKSDGPVAASLVFRDRGVEMDEWEELVFDYHISGPGLAWWGVKIIDYPLADGWQATWQITDQSLLTPGQWHTVVIKLHEPLWRWGDRPDHNSQVIWFRAQLAHEAKPVTVLVDNVRVRRAAVRLDASPAEEPMIEGDKLSRIFGLTLSNFGDRPVTCRLEVAQADPTLRFPGLPRTVSLSGGERSELSQAVEIPNLVGAPKLATFTARLRLVQPDTSTVLAEKVISLGTPLGKIPHPVLMLTREEVPAVLAAAEKTKRLGDALASLLKTADAWLTRPLEFPDRGGQWWHWYTCKKCGSGLKTESPTQHVCPACGEVYSGWPYDDVVLDRQHSALANGARDLALAYLLTGKPEYARRAVEILLGYSQRYESYPLHDIHGKPTGGGHVGPQTLDEAVWLIPIAQAFDAVQDMMTAQDRQQIVDHLLLPAAKTTWAPNLGVHNISCWRNSAYALVGLALDREDMVRAAYSEPGGYLQQVSTGVLPPGVWYEGAWGYHFYTMSALLPFVEAGGRAGLDVLVKEYRALYEGPLEFVAPDMLLPAFNDSGYVNLKGYGWMYAIAYRHWQDPRFAWLASQNPGGGWNALTWSVPELPAGEARFVSKLHPDAGYAVLRTDPWEAVDKGVLPSNYLALDFGPHGGGHGHPDKLSFSWWANGQLMAPDAGCIAYGNPMHDGYYRQTLAHNTLVVDGASQRPCTGKLLFFAAEGNLGLVGAAADDAYPPVRFSRILAVSGSRVIDLTLASDTTEHRYEWVYHNRGELSSNLQWIKLDKAPEGAGYQWCHEWRQNRPDGPFTAQWTEKNGKGVVLYHLTQPGTILLTALSPDQPASLRLPLLLQQRQASAVVFANVLQAFSAQAPQLQAALLPVTGGSGEQSAFAFDVTDGVNRDVLLVSLSGEEMQAGPFKLRGQAALLHFTDGKLRDVLANGKAAVWIGEEKIE